MKTSFLTAIFSLCITYILSAQEVTEKNTLQDFEKEALRYVYEGNKSLVDGELVEGEKFYRKAIISDPNNFEAKYNLGVSNYKSKNFQEAISFSQKALKNAKNEGEKHIAYHNLGNMYLMMGENEKAIEAYKDALRNNPTDDETRYNLAVAKQQQNQEQQNNEEDQEQQEDQNNEGGDNNDQDNQKDQSQQKEKEEDSKDQDTDEQSEDPKEGDREEDEDQNEDPKGDPNEKKEDQSDEERQEKPQQRSQLSPEQIESLLEAMQNEEKKVQEKMNGEKAKGAKVNVLKDW